MPPGQDLCRSARVCKGWKAVCDSKEFWREVDLCGRLISPRQVRSGAPVDRHLALLGPVD